MRFLSNKIVVNGLENGLDFVQIYRNLVKWHGNLLIVEHVYYIIGLPEPNFGLPNALSHACNP